MHPAEIFEGYDYSIYIDGNIKLISTISKLIQKVNENRGLAIHKHSSNNCISKEILDCRAYGKGNLKKLKEQVNRYFEKGFPKEYGMLECNVLVMDLKNKEAIHIFEDWWKEYLNSESRRDQIALPYVLWKNNVKVEEIGTLGENINKNPLFKINSHI